MILRFGLFYIINLVSEVYLVIVVMFCSLRLIPSVSFASNGICTTVTSAFAPIIPILFRYVVQIYVFPDRWAFRQIVVAWPAYSAGTDLIRSWSRIFHFCYGESEDVRQFNVLTEHRNGYDYVLFICSCDLRRTAEGNV